MPGTYRSPAESGLYYLKNRYYDPQICRYINSDDASNLGVNHDFVSLNPFTYCGNSPVNRVDGKGKFWNIVIGAAAGAVIGAVVSAAAQLTNDPTSWKTSEFWGHVGVSAAAGAITGAIAATGIGLAGQIAINSAVGATSAVIDTAIDSGGDTEASDYLGSALIGGAFGAAAGLLGGPGTATKHMQSAFKTALHSGNWRYFLSQTTTEAIRAGRSAISSIVRGSIPTITRAVIPYLRSVVLDE